jgi:ornithine cyclodeaminase/alanine dehydrogenase-like protein (mu-crystallin family)
VSENHLLYLSALDVAIACSEIDPVACVEEALRQHASGTARVADEGVLRWAPRPGEMARTLNMPGILLGDPTVVGTKIINANTGNPDRGLPRADGLTLLFDPASARPYGILQAAQISALRTAAISVAAARRLHRPGADTLAVIGAGPIARAHALLMLKYLPLHRVLLSDQVTERAEALAKEVRDSDGVDSAVADPESAVRGADIVVTATTVTDPYLPFAWLKRGSVTVNVSLDDVAADAYLRADSLYVDDWKLITHDSQRLLGRLARDGVISGPEEP